MQPTDPLDQLLASWQPRSPAVAERFVADTMRAVRTGRLASPWHRWLARLDEAAQEWLPAPGALLPAMGAIVLLLGASHFTVATSRASATSALEWRDSVLKPASPLWISAAYHDIASAPSSAHP